MAVKAINDLIGPNGIIPTLLVFRTYPYIIKNSLLLLFITKQTEAIHKAIKEV
jgi:hypothetical protein